MVTKPYLNLNGKHKHLYFIIDLSNKCNKTLCEYYRYNRSTWIEGVVYSGGDRHNGEIASFYLSLLLGLRRTPVAVGRRIRLTSEILEKADVDLAATFHVNSKLLIIYQFHSSTFHFIHKRRSKPELFLRCLQILSYRIKRVCS